MQVAMELDDDWQSRKSVIECNKHMWTTKEASDITFIVGSEKERIQAHKYILISRSRVFYAMLAGPLSNNTGNEVDIPDIDVDTFNTLMMFLYCDTAIVDLNNVLALLYAAKKYCIQSLIDKCLNKLKSNMVQSNVCVVMETAHMYGNDELRVRSKVLIMRTPRDVFRSDTLSELCPECFESIIKEDELSMSESEVFDAVVRYASERCNKQGLQITPENQLSVLGRILKEVRFPLIDKDYFMENVETSNLLSESDCLKLYRYYLKKPADCPGFITRPRKLRSIVLRFAEMGAGWGYKRDKVDALTFTCSSDVLIHGIQLYGSNGAPCTYEVKVKLVQEPYKAIVCQKNAILETDGAQRVFDFLYDKPAKITKDKRYTFQISLKGQDSFSGEYGEEEIVEDGVTFRFEHSPLSTNNTTVQRGQIPAIVFEKIPDEVNE